MQQLEKLSQYSDWTAGWITEVKDSFLRGPDMHSGLSASLATFSPPSPPSGGSVYGIKAAEE